MEMGYVDLPSIDKNEPVRYDKYRIKIEYYKDVYSGNEIMADKPNEVIYADVLMADLNNLQVIDPVLKNQFENVLRMLCAKLEMYETIDKGDE